MWEFLYQGGGVQFAEPVGKAELKPPPFLFSHSEKPHDYKNI